MKNFANQKLHIQTAIDSAADWKIDELTWQTERYYSVIARGWGDWEAWFLYGSRVAQMLGHSERSRMPRREFMHLVATHLDATASGLESVVRLTGAAPWAVAMLYVLGA
jgi:hypothetical protein